MARATKKYLTDQYDPHRSRSVALTEVRTVLSRVLTALQQLPSGGIKVDPNWPGRYAESAPHIGHDQDEMRLALQVCARLLKRWERRGGKPENDPPEIKTIRPDKYMPIVATHEGTGLVFMQARNGRWYLMSFAGGEPLEPIEEVTLSPIAPAELRVSDIERALVADAKRQVEEGT